MRVLELFCGTKSVGKAFEAARHEVFTVDIVEICERGCDNNADDYETIKSEPGQSDHSTV